MRLGKRFLDREDGGIGLFAGVGLVVLLGVSAMALDFSSAQAEKRRLQDLADLSALSAANDPAAAQARVRATLDGNGGRAVTVESITFGSYVADATKAPSARLSAVASATDPAANAVTVTLASTARTPFAALLTKESTPVVRAAAVAARQSLVSFELGSSVATLDNGVLNRVLGNALGTNVSLSLVDYRGLAGFSVTAKDLLDAISVRSGVQLAPYPANMATQIRMVAVIGALRDLSARHGSSSTEALSRLLLSSGSRTVPLSALFRVSPLTTDIMVDDLLGQIHLSALSVLRASADILNENRVIDLPGLSIGIPGVLTADAKLWVGERSQSSGWITLAPTGVWVSTAQARLWLKLEVAPSLITGLDAGVTVLRVSVPAYAEVAGAVARLTGSDCRAKGTASTMVTFAPSIADNLGGTNLARGFLGSFPGADNGVSAPFDPALLSYAPVVDARISLRLGLATVTIPLVTYEAMSQVTIGKPSMQSIGFAGNTPLPATRSYWNDNLASSIVTALLSPATVRLRAASSSLVGIILTPVLNVIYSTQNKLQTGYPAVAAPIVDTVVNDLSQRLGLTLGRADLTLLGVACRVQIIQ